MRVFPTLARPIGRRHWLALALASLWSSPAASQELLLHMPLDGTLDNLGTIRGEPRLYVKDGEAEPGFVPGQLRQGMLFDSKAVIAVPFNLDHNNYPAVTMTAWVKEDAETNNTRAILSSGSSAGASIGVHGGRLAAKAGRTGISFDKRFTPAEWVFVAAVVDVGNGYVRMHQNDDTYIRDGIDTRAEPPREFSNPDAPDAEKQPYLFIGGAQFLNWQQTARRLIIDDVRLYSGALTEAQVQAIRQVEPEQSTEADGSDRLVDTRSRQATRSEGGLSQTSGIESVVELPQGVGRSGIGLDQETIDEALETRPAPPLTTSPDSGAPSLTGRPAGGPELIAPDDQPGDELLSDIAAARESTPQLVPVDELQCEVVRDGSAPVIRRQGAFPTKFIQALNRANRCNEQVTVASLNANGQWIVSTATEIAHSTNVPQDMIPALRQFSRDHGGLTAADIGESGMWLIAAGTEAANSAVPRSALMAVRRAGRQGLSITSFDLDPADNQIWAMVDSAGSVHGERLSEQMQMEIAQLPITQRRVHQVAFTPRRGWIMLGSDLWFSSGNVYSEVLEELRGWRADNRRVDFVAFNDSDSDYLTYSVGTEPSRVGDPIYQIESGVGGSTIWSRMANYGLLGVSIAMVRGNDVVWARGYGYRTGVDEESYIRPDTSFDAASISKPIAALALLQLVESGELSLTAEGVLSDIEPFITQQRLQDFRDALSPGQGNLIQLLQHCIGVDYANASGAAEYPVDEDLPFLEDMILGMDPASEDHRLVRSLSTSGTASDYTSANFMLVQALIERHGAGFHDHVESLMGDLGMTVNSTYRSPYSGRHDGNFARGWNGTSITPLYAYAETAAASLVSTPADVARFVIGVNRLADGDWADGPLTRQMVERFIGRDSDIFGSQTYGTCSSTQFGTSSANWALGVRFDTAWSGNELFTHGGVHNGYRTRMFGFPGIDSGVVVFMTGSSSQADRFFNELRNAIIGAYSF